MPSLSYASALLEHWGVPFQVIPTSDAEKKKEADLLADFDGVQVIIEEKTKEDNPEYLTCRAEELERGQTHPLCRWCATKLWPS
jgi:Holliday junction resolvase